MSSDGNIARTVRVMCEIMSDTPAIPNPDKLATLQQRSKEVSSLAVRIMQAAGGNNYPLDLLFLAALNRTYAQIFGFTSMIGARNFVCAAPLIRLQLDTALRVFAGTLVDDPHGFTMSVLGGTAVRKLASRDGEKMTDAYLVKRLSAIYPWVDDVYKHTSGYIHLSEKHFFSSVGSLEADNTFTFKISAEDSNVSAEDYEEAMDAFSAALDIFFQLASDWARTKDKQ